MHQKRAHEGAQLSAAGVCIGIIGCVIITASSVYTALKMGALPWPTIFTSICALLGLRAFGRRSLNEANITQIIMSAGSMVAGGLAFTIPGIWILGLADTADMPKMFFVALAGTLLGLVCCALIRKRFVDESDLEYPIGVAAASTLTASEVGGSSARKLTLSLGFAGIWCALRDALGVLPSLFLQLPLAGTVALYNSPMMLAVGFLMGGTAALFWLVGVLIGPVGILNGATFANIISADAAPDIVSSLGMGLMMGSGFGVIVKDVLPHVASLVRRGDKSRAASSAAGTAANTGPATDIRSKRDAGTCALMVALAAAVLAAGLRLSPLATVLIVLLSFVTTIMSAQSVGQTGIDPMEIFGLIVLLIVAGTTSASDMQLFLVAGVIAVACGVGGDVMSDFKTGAIIGTNPRSMWYGQVLGTLIGCVVATLTMSALLSAFGPASFGPGKDFVAAQASVVAAMVSGIPSISAFVTGVVAGVILHCLNMPAMMIGLGVYLPFYLSITGILGAGIKWIYDRVGEKKDDPQAHESTGIIVASGLIGGESIVGVLIALVQVAAGLLG